MKIKGVKLFGHQAIILIFTFVFLITSDLVHAKKYYRCSDANGNSMYSDTKCSGQNRTQIRAPIATVTTPKPNTLQPKKANTPEKRTTLSREDKVNLEKRNRLVKKHSELNVKIAEKERDHLRIKNKIAKRGMYKGRGWDANFKTISDSKNEIQKLCAELKVIEAEIVEIDTKLAMSSNINRPSVKGDSSWCKEPVDKNRSPRQVIVHDQYANPYTGQVSEGGAAVLHDMYGNTYTGQDIGTGNIILHGSQGNTVQVFE